jgi:hypothetical protein
LHLPSSGPPSPGTRMWSRTLDSRTRWCPAQGGPLLVPPSCFSPFPPSWFSPLLLLLSSSLGLSWNSHVAAYSR